METDKQHEPVIIARNLKKHFGDFEAVKGVNFSVYAGECFGLLGPNGAGKSSIVKMLYGFSPVTAGTLEVFGADVRTGAKAIKARIGVVSQEDDLDPELTVRENLLVYAGFFQMNGDLAQKRTEEILAFMDLKGKAEEKVENLSGGLKRRLTLGRGLINQPELILMDEPTTGLDPYARHLIWRRLRQLKENGATLLLTTHYMEEASQLCDRLIILSQGEIVEEGKPLELIKHHVGKEALELAFYDHERDRDRLLDDSQGLIKSRQMMGDDLVLFTDHGLELMEGVCEKASRLNIPVRYRRLRPSNMEDVYLKLTGAPLIEDTSMPFGWKQGEEA